MLYYALVFLLVGVIAGVLGLVGVAAIAGQQVKNALGEAFAASLESAKWKLWHGNADDALTKLALLRDNVSDEVHRSKLTGLYEYLDRNQVYIVNYDAREQANKTYTPVKWRNPILMP